jgi:hypothetical protein
VKPNEPGEAEQDELAQLLKRAEAGDRSVLPQLQRALDGNAALWRGYGDLAAHAEASLAMLAAGPNLLLAESLKRKLAELKAELGGASPSPLEKLLVERVTATWLQTNYHDSLVAQAAGGRGGPAEGASADAGLRPPPAPGGDQAAGGGAPALAAGPQPAGAAAVSGRRDQRPDDHPPRRRAAAVRRRCRRGELTRRGVMLSWEEADKVLRRRGPPRRRKAPGPARPAAPSPAEAAAAPLLDALTDRDEPRRQAAVGHVLRTCVPAVVALLCRCLVERLVLGAAENRRAVRASLVQIGAAAVPALYCRLLGARGAGTQLALVEALVAIGQGLSPGGRVDLMHDLMIARGSAAGDSARQAIDRAVATLRRLNERAARTGRAPSLKTPCPVSHGPAHPGSLPPKLLPPPAAPSQSRAAGA